MRLTPRNCTGVGSYRVIIVDAVRMRRAAKALLQKLWRHIWIPHRLVGRRRARERAHADEVLLQALPKALPPLIKGTVLVDSMWHNPNWWLRYGLLRSALGLETTQEVGVLGEFNRIDSLPILERMGIRPLILYDFRAPLEEFEQQARELLASVRTQAEFLSLVLPDEFPAAILYDWLLKKQRSATVDLAHPALQSDVARALQTIHAGRCLVEQVRPSLLVVSHSVSVDFTALSWAAIRLGIPVVIGHGEYGLCRYWKVRRPDDLPMCANVPTAGDIEKLSSVQRESLHAVGSAYLDQRMTGAARDLGSKYAFCDADKIDREAIHRIFGWDDDRPLIAIYSMSWFDFPHIYGNLFFTDPLDWVKSTIEQISRIDSVHWLLRPHPCDAWYKAMTLADLLPDVMPAHMGLAPLGWNGADVASSVDGLVTLYGTAGIEFAAQGKPVLVGGQAWYDQCGFVICPRSRDEYFGLLRTEWWNRIDRKLAMERARLFAGWHFCAPDWQGQFVMEDDSEKEAIYPRMPDWLGCNGTSLAREVNTIRAWWEQDTEAGYHSFKMRHADAYSLSNVAL